MLQNLRYWDNQLRQNNVFKINYIEFASKSAFGYQLISFIQQYSFGEQDVVLLSQA